MRREHLVKQHLLETRYGIASDYRIPAMVTYLRPSVTETFDTEPLPTQATRIPSEKSPFNMRGSRINPLNDRSVVIESELEFKAGKILTTKEIVDLREQWPRVQYIDRDGVERTYTFDLWVRKRNGKRIAIAVKPFSKVETSALIDVLLAIYDQGIEGLADDVSFVLEFYASDYAAANADDILFYRRARNEEDVAEARELLKSVRGRIRFGELLKGLEIQAFRRAALWNLIDEGVLRPATPCRIEDHSLMEVVDLAGGLAA